MNKKNQIILIHLLVTFICIQGHPVLHHHRPKKQFLLNRNHLKWESAEMLGGIPHPPPPNSNSYRDSEEIIGGMNKLPLPPDRNRAKHYDYSAEVPSGNLLPPPPNGNEEDWLITSSSIGDRQTVTSLNNHRLFIGIIRLGRGLRRFFLPAYIFNRFRPFYYSNGPEAVAYDLYDPYSPHEF